MEQFSQNRKLQVSKNPIQRHPLSKISYEMTIKHIHIKMPCYHGN